MDKYNFKQLCNSFLQTTCVVSVERKENGYGELRIVDGNEPYIASFKTVNGYAKHDFIPNSLYTDYLEKNLNFEEYCYRSAVKKELLHSYAYPEYFKYWMHMIFIPINYETDKCGYCLYIMENSNEFNPDILANTSVEVDTKVLRATLKLANSGDFNESLSSVTQEVRKICDASFCCILLIDDLKEELKILAEDRDLSSSRLNMKDYMDESFYDLVKSWDNTIGNSNCIIINDNKGMEYVKQVNEKWYNSLIKNKIDSLVLFRLKSNNNQIGYMWVSDFKASDTPKIKETLEITTFILGFEIGNHVLLDRLTTLSSIDVLTGLFNRNKMNDYMNEISESNDNISIIFLDINGLKKVNDNEGHLAGDNLIKRAANALKNVFAGYYVFRAGGDEFVVILKNVTEKRINELIEKLLEKAKKVNVSFAYGYSITNNSEDVEKILKEADVNMYNNKRKFYDSLNKRTD